MKRLWVLFFILLSTLCSAQTIKVGCFNIQIFGETKASQPNTLTVLAQIANQYDLLAVEEVGSNGSKASDETCTAVMDRYLARVNEIAGSPVYAYIRGNQYAILYRTDKIQIQSSALYAGSQSFSYSPLTAYCRTVNGNLDFSIVVVHTSPKLAKEEIPALRIAMDEVAKTYSEPDVICMGDYNGDGSYYHEGEGEGLAGFTDCISVIPNSADTTVATSALTYDRIELTQSMQTDYVKEWGVMEFGKLFDVIQCEGSEKRRGTELAVSDHYPVWCELYDNKDED